jgi:hypothetical protein
MSTTGKDDRVKQKNFKKHIDRINLGRLKKIK